MTADEVKKHHRDALQVTQKKKVKKNPTDNSRDKLLTGLINVLLK